MFNQGYAALLSSAIFTTLMASHLLFIGKLHPNKNAQPMAVHLSPLGLEGRDLFNSVGCAHCHSSTSPALSHIIAGASFAPQHPFTITNSMDHSQLQDYFLGPGNLTSSKQSGDEPLYHKPSYQHLHQRRLNSSDTQQKMLAVQTTQVDRDEVSTNELVTASISTAGATELEAILQYLRETSVKLTAPFEQM